MNDQAEALQAYQQYPDIFYQDVLRAELDPFQAQIVSTVRDHPRVHIQTANAIGKTFTLAQIALWFLFCYPPSTVVCTASTGRQLYGQLWTEISKAYMHVSIPGLGGELQKTQLIIEPGWQMVAFSTSEEANFEGWHNENIMVIFDEAKGIEPDIYRGAERVLRGTPGVARWVVASTPPLGPIGEFVRLKNSPPQIRTANGDFENRWKYLQLSAWDSPRVSDAECQATLDDYGEESPFYQSMIMGQIPMAGEDNLIDGAWVEEAIARDSVPRVSPRTIGVDVARFGDDETVIIACEGGNVLCIEPYHKQDTVFVTEKTKGMAIRYRADVIRVDATGVGGGVVDMLHAAGFPVDGVDAASSPDDPSKYYDRVTEDWAKLAEMFKEGSISIPDDALLKAQLVSRRFEYRIKGGETVMKLESKKDMKGKGMRSPDRADALVLALVLGSPPQRSRILATGGTRETYNDF